MDHELAREVSRALRRVSTDEVLKRRIQSQAWLQPLSERWLGGRDLVQCLDTVHGLNEAGIDATVDYMGESCRDAESVGEAVAEFKRLIEAVADRGLRCSVSLDLSHIGLSLGDELAFDNLRELLRRARERNVEIVISAEGVGRTDRVLRVYQRLAVGGGLGITLQANLRRSPSDVETLAGLPGKLRLVKGAFGEREEVALARGPELDRRYLQLVERALALGLSLSIGTHDSRLIRDIEARLVAQDDARYEFEMLHGATPAQLNALRDRGHRVRTFVPYGHEWFLYVCHRLAEHPPNLVQAFVDVVDSHAGNRP